MANEFPNWMDKLLQKDVQDETGLTLPTRKALQLVGSGVTVADDAANDRTVATITAGGSVFVNVKDFGAVGDGSHDDTTPFLNAIASVTVGGTVYIPAGTYKLTGNVNFGTKTLARFDQLAMLRPTSSAVTVVLGHIDATPNQQLFDVSLGGIVQIANEATIYVKWFGAKGDGVTDDTIALRAAVASTIATQVTCPAPTYGQLNLGVEVYFASGIYLLTGEVPVQDWVFLHADHNTTITSTSSTITLLRIAGYRNRIEGFNFHGGKHHITVYGPSTAGGAYGTPTAGGPNWIQNCSFQYAAGPSFYFDTTLTTAVPAGSYPPGRQESSASFHFSNCDMAGPVFLYGCADGIFYEDCYAFWDLSGGAVNDDNGNPLGAFNSGDHLSIERFLGVPNTGSVLQAAWVQGSGAFKMRDVRFGGETTYTTFRIRKVMPLYGMTLHIGWSGNEIWCDNCAPTGNGDHDWLQVYDQFPATVNIVSGESGGTGGSGDFGPTYGIWVDSVSCPVSTFVNQSNGQIRLNLQDAFGNTFDFPRIYTSAAPTTPGSGWPPAVSPAGMQDLVPVLRRFMHGEKTTSRTEALENLYQSALTNVVGIWNDSSSHVTETATDSALGYLLNVFTATADGGIVNISDPNTWGGALAAGEYTISFYMRSSFGARVFIGHDSTILALRDVHASGVYERVSVTFWHDGTAKKFFVQVYEMPNAQTFVVGLPMVNRGRHVAPYAFPVNTGTGGNVTLEELAITTYYASGMAGPPTAGTYQAGDRYIDIAPPSGGPDGWQCIAAGTPGTWKPTGAVHGRVQISDTATSSGNIAIPTQPDLLYNVTAVVSAFTGSPAPTSFVIVSVAKSTTDIDIFLQTAPGVGTSVYVDWILVR